MGFYTDSQPLTFIFHHVSRSPLSWPNQVLGVQKVRTKKKRLNPAEHSTQGLDQRSQKPDSFFTVYSVYDI